jgi:hypothetical protein
MANSHPTLINSRTNGQSYYDIFGNVLIEGEMWSGSLHDSRTNGRPGIRTPLSQIGKSISAPTTHDETPKLLCQETLLPVRRTATFVLHRHCVRPCPLSARSVLSSESVRSDKDHADVCDRRAGFAARCRLVEGENGPLTGAADVQPTAELAADIVTCPKM